MEKAVQYELEYNEEELEQPDVPDEPDMVEPFDPSKIKIQPKQDTLRNLIDRLSTDRLSCLMLYWALTPDDTVRYGRLPGMPHIW